MSAVRAIRRTLRPIRRMAKAAHKRMIELPYLLRRPAFGSAEWLVRSEVKYGGYVTNVTRRRVSPRDERTAEQLTFGGMTGGDRMLHHGYAEIYSEYLVPLLGAHDLTVAEFGILNGSGLAIWCDLFPKAFVLGFDIDLAHFEDNRSMLIRRGAFQLNTPHVHEYDQLIDGAGLLAKTLSGRTVDIVVDDGLHSLDAIITTWRSVRPYLSDRFVYFIEDFPCLLDQCATEFSDFNCRSRGMMTMISARVPGNEGVPCR